MTEIEKLRETFSKDFFEEKGSHHRSMNVLASYLSKEYNEQDDPYIDEHLVRSEYKRIMEGKIKLISPALKVQVNQNNKILNELIRRTRSGVDVSMALDLQVVYKDEGLIAAFELKSLCNANVGKPDDIYRDFHRLSLVKAVLPDVTCVFILAGIDSIIEDLFTNKSLRE